MKTSQIEISISVTGKIPRRQFENYSPFYSVKEIITLEDSDGDQSKTDIIRKARQQELRNQLEDLFSKDRERIQLEELQSTYKNFDFVLNPKNNKKYPRVTDILYWDADFYISPEKLVQYGARGSAIHAMIEHWIETKEWGEYKKIIRKRDYILLETGSERLIDTLDQINFVGFMDEYGKDIEFGEGEFRAFNDQYFYCGQPDRVGKYKKKKAIFDYKCRAIQDSDFKQMAMYCNLDDPRLKDIETMVGIPLNPSNKSGYGRPVVVEGRAEIEKYFNLALKDRYEFKDKFKI